MSKTMFVPVSAGNIEEGRMLSDLDSEIEHVVKALIAHRNEYGNEAKGAKGEVNLKVTFQVEEGEDVFAIKSSISHKKPGRPTQVTMAMAGETELEEPCLFTRVSGTTGDDPAQMRLATQDGRGIDPESGEAIE